MFSTKHVLLQGNENFLDRTKSVALYGKLYWCMSDKKLNVGDIVCLFVSGIGHYQIRYKQEVTDTSVPRPDENVGWLHLFLIMIALNSYLLQSCMRVKSSDVTNWNKLVSVEMFSILFSIKNYCCLVNPLQAT